jgi:8-oxo-dGTP diphosphatase
LKLRISTAGVAEKEGRYFLALRKPGTSIGECWEFPGGKAEEGESSTEALSREFMEEFGVIIKVGKLLCTGSFRNGPKLYRLEAYSITFPTGTPSEKNKYPEHQRTGWFTLEECRNREIAESDSIILDYIGS